MSTYSIEGDVIHYVADEDTGRVEDIRISDILEFFVWLKRRETDLRYLVHNAPQLLEIRDIPKLPKRQPLTRQGDYYVGITEDLLKVKVKAQVFEDYLKAIERKVRENWLYDKKKTGIPASTII